jgi:hypothetical protein
MRKKEIGVGKWKAKALYCGYHIAPKSFHTVGYDADLVMKMPYWRTCCRTENRIS